MIERMSLDGAVLAGERALETLQALLRMDTCNPPSVERAAAEYLASLLSDARIPCEILEKRPGRSNLIARMPGTGRGGGPLLITAHLDTVPFGDGWKYPPLSGAIEEGFVWGRGAIDMKNMAAMCVATMCRLVREGAVLERDLIFAAVADEEAGCTYGSKFLVEEHPERVTAEYLLGEVGGFNSYLGDTQFFPIQVASKGLVWMRAHANGAAGHASVQSDDNAVIKLARAIARLDHVRLPQHATRVSREFITRVAKLQPAVKGLVFRALQRPSLSPFILDNLFPDPSMARSVDASLRNTVTPTGLEAGINPNVIPSRATAIIDARFLPGQTVQSVLSEIQAVVGEDIVLETFRELPAAETDPIDSPLLQVITDVVQGRMPGSHVVPYLCPGFTDAAFFGKLGARAYGFTPVIFARETGVKFAELFHGVDERISVDGFQWGNDVFYDVVKQFVAPTASR
jgi:acetylornithine deacetylase/succinyl-diaminopimelate desuccinylase-like protein